jgi:phosphoenolpyruvate carboxylase
MTDDELVIKAEEQAKLTLEAGKSKQAYIKTVQSILDYEKLTGEQKELVELIWETDEKIHVFFEDNNLEKLLDLLFEHYEHYRNKIIKLVEFFVKNHESLKKDQRFSEIYQKNERILLEYLNTQKEKSASDE